MTNPTLGSILAAWPVLATKVTASEDEGPYTVAGNIAHQLVAAMASGESDGMSVLFGAIEERLRTASPDDRDLIIVGLLEDLQNVSMNRGVDLELWRPLLGTRSAEAWDVLIAMWAGKVTPAEFKAFVERGAPPTLAGDA